MASTIPFKQLFSLIGITISAFIFNTSEFMPIGLLTDISASFSMTEAQTGIMITAYAWVVALLSLPLMLVVCKIEYRKLLLGVIALFGIGQLLAGLSVSFGMLLIARICVACAHSVFWSIASPIAVQLVSREHRSMALSMVTTGTAIAMILGLPLGRIVGLYLGWRMTFLCIAAIALGTVVYLLAIFPRLPNRSTFSLHQLPGLIKKPALTSIYIITALMATAYYTGYSYIEPFLLQVGHMSEDIVTIALIVFGVSGLVGSFLFSKLYNHFRYGFIRWAFMGLTASLLLLYPASGSVYTAIALCGLWGMAAMAFCVSFQAETIQCASLSASAVAMSIYSGIFNLGIGSGTWIGGAVTTYVSLEYIGYVGGLLGLAATLYCSVIFIGQLKKIS